MSFEYVNRRGDRYYLTQGKTKTGKPKYYMSKKAEGALAEELPEGFEVYEEPVRALVSVRKVRPSPILPIEREQLAQWTKALGGIDYFRVNIEDDSLVVYTPATDPTEVVAAIGRIMGPFFGTGVSASAVSAICGSSTYTAMLRFTLSDEAKRLFAVERWCFRGSIDGWFPLAGGQPLETQARKYLPHLSRQSFFDLM